MIHFIKKITHIVLYTIVVVSFYSFAEGLPFKMYHNPTTDLKHVIFFSWVKFFVNAFNFHNKMIEKIERQKYKLLFINE